jgi:hypothetical protein
MTAHGRPEKILDESSGCWDANADHTYRIYLRATEKIDVTLSTGEPCSYDPSWYATFSVYGATGGCQGTTKGSRLFCVDQKTNQATSYTVPAWYYLIALPFAGFITTPILSTVWFEIWKHAAEMYQEMNQRVFYVAPSEQDRKAGLLYAETLPWGVPVQSAPFHAIADDHLVFLGALRPKAGVEEAIEVARLADRTLVLLGAVQDRVFFDRHVAPHLGERLRHHEDPASPEADRLIGQAVGVVHVGGGAGMQQLALLDAHKAHANLILMGPGSLYDDPDGLLSGSGTLGRHLKVTKLEALPQDAVRAWLRVAAEHARRT